MGLFVWVGWLGPGLLVSTAAWHAGVWLVFFFCSGFRCVVRRPGISIVGRLGGSVESSFLIHQVIVVIYSFVLDSLAG